MHAAGCATSADILTLLLLLITNAATAAAATALNVVYRFEHQDYSAYNLGVDIAFYHSMSSVG